MTFNIKKLICILLCLCLVFCCACKADTVSPDKEALVTQKGETRPTTPQVVDDQDITGSKGIEAELTQEELNRAWSYSFLNEQEQRIYRIMLNMVRHLSEGWIEMGYISGDVSTTVAKAYRALCNDFPEYYWMPASYYITVNSNNVTLAFKRNHAEDGYGFTKTDIENNKEDFDDAVQRIIERTEKASSDFEKEVIIHDLLCKTAQYDSEFDWDDANTVYSAYGALVNGRAVCEGYARAFKLLCQYAGIECILVTGESKGVGHMWNMVKLEGNWYHVDVTWDDLRAEPHHTYLNLTEIDILADHDIDATYSNTPSNLTAQGNSYNFSVPEATNSSMNFFIKKGLMLSSTPIEDFTKEIIAKYNSGEYRAELMFSDKAIAEDFKENYETYVVKIQDKCVKEMGKLRLKITAISFPADTCVIYFEKV